MFALLHFPAFSLAKLADFGIASKLFNIFLRRRKIFGQKSKRDVIIVLNKAKRREKERGKRTENGFRKHGKTKRRPGREKRRVRRWQSPRAALAIPACGV